MRKNVLRISETELVRLIKRVINEQEDHYMKYDDHRKVNNNRLNEVWDGTMETLRRAFDIKSSINYIRENYSDDSWKDDDEVLELFNELSLIGFFYDDDSWDVFPEEDF